MLCYFYFKVDAGFSCCLDCFNILSNIGDVEGISFPGYRRNISEDIRFNRAVTPSILCANKQHVTIKKKNSSDFTRLRNSNYGIFLIYCIATHLKNIS